jgi:hypothetical protein
MPELKDVLPTVATTTKDAQIVDVTTIDTDNNVTTTAVDTAVAKKPPVKKVATPAKKVPPSQVKKVPVKKIPTKEKADTADTVDTTAVDTSVNTESTEITETVVEPNKVEVNETDQKTDINLRRPPMEQLTKDLEKFILSLKIDDIPIKKLEYKCGKVIFGINNESGKDFRVIAYKARKKSKTVAGKSRCIFFFGIHKDVATIIKQFPGTSTTEFGKCSVQCKKPIQLILDKQTFSENFDQDIEKVISLLKQLATLTIEQKNEQWKLLQEKIAAKNVTKETETTPAGSE